MVAVVKSSDCWLDSDDAIRAYKAYLRHVGVIVSCSPGGYSTPHSLARSGSKVHRVYGPAACAGCRCLAGVLSVREISSGLAKLKSQRMESTEVRP